MKYRVLVLEKLWQKNQKTPRASMYVLYVSIIYLDGSFFVYVLLVDKLIF